MIFTFTLLQSKQNQPLCQRPFTFLFFFFFFKKRIRDLHLDTRMRVFDCGEKRHEACKDIRNILVVTNDVCELKHLAVRVDGEIDLSERRCSPFF